MRIFIYRSRSYAKIFSGFWAIKLATMDYSFGTACIPAKPQRIVALDIPVILDSLLALGIKPVGMVADNYERAGKYFPALFPDKVGGIETVDTEASPSLEKILTLKPDLILSFDVPSERYYKQLSAIAPTVIMESDKGKLPFKETLRFIARLVG